MTESLSVEVSVFCLCRFVMVTHFLYWFSQNSTRFLAVLSVGAARAARLAESNLFRTSSGSLYLRDASRTSERIFLFFSSSCEPSVAASRGLPARPCTHLLPLELPHLVCGVHPRRALAHSRESGAKAGVRGMVVIGFNPHS